MTAGIGESSYFDIAGMRELGSTKRVAGQALATPTRPEALIPSLTTGRDLGMMMPRPGRDARQPATVGTSLYFYYDVNDTLIYLGITDRGITRNREHNSRAEWWPFVARQEVQHFTTRRAAEAEERELIRRYRPPFNKQHNPYYKEVREEYLAWVAQPPVDARELALSLGKRVPLRVIEQDEFRLILGSSLEHSAVVLRIRPKGPTERITVSGYSARVSQVHWHAGLLLVHVTPRTSSFPMVASGAAGIKFESQKPASFRLVTIHVAPRVAGDSL